MTDRLTPRGLVLAIVTALCSGIGIALMKHGLAGEVLRVAFLAAGLLVYGTGIVCGMVLLSVYPLSLAYPIVVGLGLAVLAVTSSLWLAEPFTLSRLAGTLLVIVGVLLLAGDPVRLKHAHVKTE
jgi:multidrug transporter EmrE-like cation transporter